MKTVTVYTDGACSGNPGPGGWAAILQYNGGEAFRNGNLGIMDYYRMKNIEADTQMRDAIARPTAGPAAPTSGK